MPEPGVVLILLFGLPAIWLILGRRRRKGVR
ncbi:MAG: PEP-CTERM sorting domain-containing protein [Parvularculaceae bacterium]